MKLKFLIVPIMILIVPQVACKKETTTNTQFLYGSWKLTQVYDPYGSGGSDRWQEVLTEDEQYLEFTASGEYKKKVRSSGALQQCAGTYQLLSGNKLEVTATCEPKDQQLILSKLTPDSLIVDRLGTEGIIRYQYIAVK